MPKGSVERWSLDLAHDQLVDGRHFRMLNVIDDYIRVCLDQVVDFSIGGERVTSLLDQLVMGRGLPSSIVCGHLPPRRARSSHRRRCSSGAVTRG